MDIGVYSIFGLWSFFIYSCYNQYKIEKQKQKSLQQRQKSQNLKETLLGSKQVLINLLSKINIFKPQKSNPNYSNVEQIQAQKSEESILVNKQPTFQQINFCQQDTTNLKFNRKKLIFKQTSHEKRKKLKEYRRWVQKFRNKSNIGNWQTIYKHRNHMNMLRQISILAQLNQSQVQDDVQSYDPFIN